MLTKVLLVDDDEFARGFVRSVLERAGLEVYEADDVASALSAFQSMQPKIVVTDWNLLDGDGGLLARSLHAMGARLPVILISGDSCAIECVQLRGGHEFAAILTKPFSPSSIERAIRGALAGIENSTTDFR